MVTGVLESPLTINASFFRVVTPTNLRNDHRVRASAFKSKNDEGLSVDWTARTTALESARRQAHRWDNSPTYIAEVSASLVVGVGLNARHDPKPENDSHCEIYGDLLHDGPPEGTAARQRLANECSVLGPFDHLEVVH